MMRLSGPSHTAECCDRWMRRCAAGIDEEQKRVSHVISKTREHLRTWLDSEVGVTIPQQPPEVHRHSMALLDKSGCTKGITETCELEGLPHPLEGLLVFFFLHHSASRASTARPTTSLTHEAFGVCHGADGLRGF